MNYYAHGRSNYFFVKDKEAFKSFCKKYNLDLWEDQKDGRVGFAPIGEAGFEHVAQDPETGLELEGELLSELAPHLQEGEVAVLQEVGYEGLRYINGRAWAVNHQGKTRVVDLDSIYKKAKKLTDKEVALCHR